MSISINSFKKCVYCLGWAGIVISSFGKLKPRFKVETTLASANQRELQKLKRKLILKLSFEEHSYNVFEKGQNQQLLKEEKEETSFSTKLPQKDLNNQKKDRITTNKTDMSSKNQPNLDSLSTIMNNEDLTTTIAREIDTVQYHINSLKNHEKLLEVQEKNLIELVEAQKAEEKAQIERNAEAEREKAEKLKKSKPAAKASKQKGEEKGMIQEKKEAEKPNQKEKPEKQTHKIKKPSNDQISTEDLQEIVNQKEPTKIEVDERIKNEQFSAAPERPMSKKMQKYNENLKMEKTIEDGIAQYKKEQSQKQKFLQESFPKSSKDKKKEKFVGKPSKQESSKNQNQKEQILGSDENQQPELREPEIDPSELLQKKKQKKGKKIIQELQKMLEMDEKEETERNSALHSSHTGNNLFSDLVRVDDEEHEIKVTRSNQHLEESYGHKKDYRTYEMDSEEKEAGSTLNVKNLKYFPRSANSSLPEELLDPSLKENLSIYQKVELLYEKNSYLFKDFYDYFLTRDVEYGITPFFQQKQFKRQEIGLFGSNFNPIAGKMSGNPENMQWVNRFRWLTPELLLSGRMDDAILPLFDAIIPTSIHDDINKVPVSFLSLWNAFNNKPLTTTNENKNKKSKEGEPEKEKPLSESVKLFLRKREVFFNHLRKIVLFLLFGYEENLYFFENLYELSQNTNILKKEFTTELSVMKNAYITEKNECQKRIISFLHGFSRNFSTRTYSILYPNLITFFVNNIFDRISTILPPVKDMTGSFETLNVAITFLSNLMFSSNDIVHSASNVFLKKVKNFLIEYWCDAFVRCEDEQIKIHKNYDQITNGNQRKGSNMLALPSNCQTIVDFALEDGDCEKFSEKKDEVLENIKNQLSLANKEFVSNIDNICIEIVNDSLETKEKREEKQFLVDEINKIVQDEFKLELRVDVVGSANSPFDLKGNNNIELYFDGIQIDGKMQCIELKRDDCSEGLRHLGGPFPQFEENPKKLLLHRYRHKRSNQIMMALLCISKLNKFSQLIPNTNLAYNKQGKKQQQKNELVLTRFETVDKETLVSCFSFESNHGQQENNKKEGEKPKENKGKKDMGNKVEKLDAYNFLARIGENPYAITIFIDYELFVPLRDLFSAYALYSPLARQMMILVRLFFDKKHLTKSFSFKNQGKSNTAGTFPPFVINTLVIAFLIHKKIVPNLQTVWKKEPEKWKKADFGDNMFVEGKDCRFVKNFQKLDENLKNSPEFNKEQASKASFFELFTQFLIFYGMEFDFEKFMINIAHPEVFLEKPKSGTEKVEKKKKSLLEDPNVVASEEEIAEESEDDDEDSDPANKAKYENYSLFVEHPFSRNSNLAASVSNQILAYFLELCSISSTKIQNYIETNAYSSSPAIPDISYWFLKSILQDMQLDLKLFFEKKKMSELSAAKAKPRNIKEDKKMSENVFFGVFKCPPNSANGYVKVSGIASDVVIPPEAPRNGAINGDRVAVQITGLQDESGRYIGKILALVQKTSPYLFTCRITGLEESIVRCDLNIFGKVSESNVGKQQKAIRVFLEPSKGGYVNPRTHKIKEIRAEIRANDAKLSPPILAYPIDKIYPKLIVFEREFKNIFKSKTIQNTSDYLFLVGTDPESDHFMKRGKILSCLGIIHDIFCQKRALFMQAFGDLLFNSTVRDNSLKYITEMEKEIQILKDRFNSVSWSNFIADPSFYNSPKRALQEASPSDSSNDKHNFSLVGYEDATARPMFTIDPKTSKDLDDALSVELLDESEEKVINPNDGSEDIIVTKSYLVTVFVADVSSYVVEGTEIDKDARRRTTSIYMVDNVEHMLDSTLSQDLASILPGVPRLTLSTEFVGKLKENKRTGQAIEFIPDKSTIRFVKGVAISRVQLDYGTAQMMLEEKIGTKYTNFTEEDFAFMEKKRIQFVEVSKKILENLYNNVPKSDPRIAKIKAYTWETLKEDVLIFHKIAQCLRNNRKDTGATFFDNQEISFKLQKETGFPIGIEGVEEENTSEAESVDTKDIIEDKQAKIEEVSSNPEATHYAHQLIEELMLIANGYSAQKLVECFGPNALIRIHDSPDLTRWMNSVEKIWKGLYQAQEKLDPESFEKKKPEFFKRNFAKLEQMYKEWKEDKESSSKTSFVVKLLENGVTSKEITNYFISLGFVLNGNGFSGAISRTFTLNMKFAKYVCLGLYLKEQSGLDYEFFEEMLLDLSRQGENVKKYEGKELDPEKAKLYQKFKTHYGLNESLYTHFTSPIRRYADLLVHRMIKQAIDEKPEPGQKYYKPRLMTLQPKPTEEKPEKGGRRNSRNDSKKEKKESFAETKSIADEVDMTLAAQLDYINILRDKAGKLELRIEEIYLSFYLLKQFEHKTLIREEAIVTEISEQGSFKAFIPRYDIEIDIKIMSHIFPKPDYIHPIFERNNPLLSLLDISKEEKARILEKNALVFEKWAKSEVVGPAAGKAGWREAEIKSENFSNSEKTVLSGEGLPISGSSSPLRKNQGDRNNLRTLELYWVSKEKQGFEVKKKVTLEVFSKVAVDLGVDTFTIPYHPVAHNVWQIE